MGESVPGGTSPSSSALRKRLVSGFVLAPVVLFLIYMSGWVFVAMVMVLALVALHEFVDLVKQGKNKFLHYVFGMLYLSLAFGSFMFVHFGFEQGPWLVICLIVSVWASDTGAYFMGKTIGGRKMTPRLSPNKTWAGLAGAMLFCGLALVGMQFLGGCLSGWLNTDLGLRTLDAPFVFAIGLLLGVVGQAGDLLISFYKRRVGAKDSGTLIPGHGGLLDRIDSVLLVSPAFLGILLLCL